MHRISVFKPQLARRYRVGLTQGEQTYRPILWFSLAKDASFYIAPRVSPLAHLRAGKVKSTDGVVRVHYAEGIELDPAAHKGAKISFHASGVVNPPNSERSFIQPLRNMTEQRGICNLVFAHPDQFALDRVTRRDITVNYPLSEELPLLASVYAAPSNSEVVVELPTARHQETLLLRYTGLPEDQNVTIQITLYHSVSGPWPPATYIGYWASPDGEQGRDGVTSSAL